MTDRGHTDRVAVLCRVGSRVCALPVAHVSETMRPLPVEPIAGAPAFVLGVCVVRGAPIPVIDAGRMLGDSEPSQPARFVALRIGARAAVLAVDAVLGVAAIAGDSLEELPPLLREASTEVVEAIGTRDADLLLVLTTARIVPPSVWAGLDARDPSP